MALQPGTRVGSYEITAQIGAGGMGEVYQATDTSLKREVAIKVLPDSLARDADRLARFQREAEVLASLNHPHIAQIFGFENADASTRSGQPGACLDGTVKVLDFGLAKARGRPAEAGPDEVSQSPTIMPPAMTEAGIILGLESVGDLARNVEGFAQRVES